MLCWIAFLILHLAFGVWSETACEKEEECDLKKLENLLNTKDFPSEEYLQENCGAINGSISCVQSLLQNCPEEIPEMNTPPMKEAVGFITDLCTEGSLTRTGYVKSIECFKTAIPDSSECFAHVKSLMKVINESESLGLRNSGLDTMEQARKMHCISFPLMAHCVLETIHKNCGNEQLDSAYEILDRLVLPENAVSCPKEEMLEYLVDLMDSLLSILESKE